MALSAFDDRARSPKQLRSTLGTSEILWRQLLAHAAEQDANVVEHWHFAGPKYGWSLRVKQRDRVVLHMTPCKGHFLASLVLGEKRIATEKAAGLPKPVLAALEAAPRYAEGRGIRIRVSTTRDLRLTMRLVELKLRASTGEP